MITNLRTAYKILESVGLSSVDAAAFLAVAMAKLPTGTDEWGDERKTTGKRASMAVIDVCREMKADGWKPTPVAVALLAGERLVESYEEWRLDEWQRADAEEFEERVLQAAEAEAITAAAQVEAFPTATESRALARTLVDVILDSHGLETGPDGVVRKVDTTVPDEAVTLDTYARVDDLDRYTARVVWQIGDKAGVGLWTTPEEALRDAEAGNEKHGHDTHRVDFDRRVVEKHDEREGWFAVSFDDLRAGDVFRMRERTATADGPAEVAGCDAYQNERGIWAIRARPMTPIGENPERVAADGATKPIVGHIVDVVSVEDPDFSPTGAADATPAPKKPRCGKVYGQKESMPPIPMVCTRPEGHKGGCGEAKVVGKAKAAEVGS